MGHKKGDWGVKCRVRTKVKTKDLCKACVVKMVGQGD